LLDNWLFGLLLALSFSAFLWLKNEDYLKHIILPFLLRNAKDPFDMFSEVWMR
jgi:hypothetical protein